MLTEDEMFNKIPNSDTFHYSKADKNSGNAKEVNIQIKPPTDQDPSEGDQEDDPDRKCIIF